VVAVASRWTTSGKGHHVIPDQIGRVDVPADAFLRTVENCVILCDVCHTEAHDDDTQNGAVPEPDWYRYSHGKSGNTEHRAWLLRVEKRVAPLGCPLTAIWPESFRRRRV
jgi:hypothetical protein